MVEDDWGPFLFDLCRCNRTSSRLWRDAKTEFDLKGIARTRPPYLGTPSAAWPPFVACQMLAAWSESDRA